MLVAELLLRKLQTEDEIKELENYLNNKLPNIQTSEETTAKLYSGVVSRLFNLYDKLQQQRVVLNHINSKTMLDIDDNRITMVDALEIAETLERRINLYTGLVNSDDASLSILDNMEKRSQLLSEYFKLISGIKASDWTTEID